MDPVFWAALGIGGSTLAGTACGFLFSRVTDAWRDAVAAFAAGVMLAAAVFGLFSPAMEMVSGAGFLWMAAGAACGVLLIRGVGGLTGRNGGSSGYFIRHPELLFVLAIAVHKFPEGMAGGVGLNGTDARAALTMAVGISLQNLPEGAVMMPPLLNAGVSRRRAACIAVATGLLNALGVAAGALWGRLASGALPFALAFAGGAMLDVIVTQMIPQLAAAPRLKKCTLVLCGGFTVMACVNALC